MNGLKSSLIDFEISKDRCFICGNDANTVEHVIPKWLQRKFELWNEKIEIANRTYINYRQLVVPACEKCNSEIYGELERKVSLGVANEKEIWRWANKIHFGLKFKDMFLDFDRKKPGVKIGEVFKSDDVLEKSRHFLHCLTDNFQCFPDPFGSVFKFELEKEEDFNLIHLLGSSSIYICVGKVVYIVFVTDGLLLRKDQKGISNDYLGMIKNKVTIQDTLFFYAQCVYFMEQYTFSNPIIFSKSGIAKIGRATLREEKPLDKPLFRKICRRIGIEWIDESELNKE